MPWHLIAAISLLSMISSALGQAPSASGDWPMFRGNPALTGVATSTLPGKPEVLWKFRAGEAISSSPAISDGVVYIGCDNGNLYAISLKDASLIWRSQTPATTQSTASTQTYHPGIQSSPCVYGDCVFFGDEDGVFHAISRTDGRPRWTFTTGGEIMSSPNCAGDRVLFGSYDGGLYCLSIRDGKLLWKLPTEGKVHGTPGISGDTALIVGCDEKLRVVRIADGKQLAVISVGGNSGASAAILGSRVFAGTFSNEVVALDWKDGKTVWAFEDPDRQFPFYSSAAVNDRAVVIGGRDKLVRSFDPKSGEPTWSFRTKGRVDASPLIAGDRVLAASQDGNLYAIELTTGREVWRFEAGSPINSSPALAHGRVVFGTDEGLVYCLGDGSPR